MRSAPTKGYRTSISSRTWRASTPETNGNFAIAETLFVIDSTFLLERSNDAFLGAPLLQDSSGRDTTMLFGFARDLLRLRKQLGIRNALIVIGNDQPRLPESLISHVVDFLQLLRVPVLHAEGVCAGNVCAVWRSAAPG